MGVLCLVPVQGCVHASSFAGADKDTNTLGLSLESSPTGGVCPGLCSLIIEDITKRPFGYFIGPHDRIPAVHVNTPFRVKYY